MTSLALFNILTRSRPRRCAASCLFWRMPSKTFIGVVLIWYSVEPMLALFVAPHYTKSLRYTAYSVQHLLKILQPAKWGRLPLGSGQAFTQLGGRKISLPRDWSKFGTLRPYVENVICHKKPGFSDFEPIETKGDIVRWSHWTISVKVFEETPIDFFVEFVEPKLPLTNWYILSFKWQMFMSKACNPLYTGRDWNLPFEYSITTMRERHDVMMRGNKCFDS